MRARTRSRIFVAAVALVSSGVLAWSLGCGSQSSTNLFGGAQDASMADVAAPDMTLPDGSSAIGDGGSAADGDAGDAQPTVPFVVAPHRPFPPILPHTARLLHPMTLVTIVAANDDLPNELFAFSDALVTSSWWKTVGADYGVGAAGASVHVRGPAITTDQDGPAMVAYIEAALAADSGAPAPDGTRLYLLYLPTGLKILNTAFPAYHQPFPANDAGSGDGWAAVTREPTLPNGESALDSLTLLASHEIIEAATDPGGDSYRLFRLAATTAPWDAGTVWSTMQPGVVEVGDLCEGTRIREPDTDAGYLYQRSWSMNAATDGGGDPCVPTRAEPYTNVTTPQDWYAGMPGQVVQIPFTGWSNAPTANWTIAVVNNNSAGSLAAVSLNNGLVYTTPLGRGTATKCTAYPAINNGVTGSISVTIPATAQSGDFAVLELRSFREDPTTCYASVDDDIHHIWITGVYVP